MKAEIDGLLEILNRLVDNPIVSYQIFRAFILQGNAISTSTAMKAIMSLKQVLEGSESDTTFMDIEMSIWQVPAEYVGSAMSYDGTEYMFCGEDLKQTLDIYFNPGCPYRVGAVFKVFCNAFGYTHAQSIILEALVNPIRDSTSAPTYENVNYLPYRLKQGLEPCKTSELRFIVTSADQRLDQLFSGYHAEMNELQKQCYGEIFFQVQYEVVQLLQKSSISLLSANQQLLQMQRFSKRLSSNTASVASLRDQLQKELDRLQEGEADSDEDSESDEEEEESCRGEPGVAKPLERERYANMLEAAVLMMQKMAEKNKRKSL